jgi:flagellar basal-body rod protein FlgB
MTPAIDQLFMPHQTALAARAHRSQVLASNIANADTPGYQARDVDFKANLRQALGASVDAAPALVRTSSRHLDAGGIAANSALAPLVYRTVTQASIDNNTVDVNVERAHFADNAMRYEASLTFINSKLKSLLAAIQG